MFGNILLKTENRILCCGPGLVIPDGHDLQDVTNLALFLQRRVHLPDQLHDMLDVEDAEAGDLLRSLRSMLLRQGAVRVACCRDQMPTVATSRSADEGARLEQSYMSVGCGFVLQKSLDGAAACDARADDGEICLLRQ